MKGRGKKWGNKGNKKLHWLVCQLIPKLIRITAGSWSELRGNPRTNVCGSFI